LNKQSLYGEISYLRSCRGVYSMHFIQQYQYAKKPPAQIKKRKSTRQETSLTW